MEHVHALISITKKFYFREKIWHCQKDDSLQQEVKKEGLIISLPQLQQQNVLNAVRQKCPIGHALTVDTTEGVL